MNVDKYKQRAYALVVLLYAAPLYAVAELVHASRGKEWDRLENHLDRVDDWLSEREAACIAADDTEFVEGVGAASEKFYLVVWKAAAWLAREPVR